MCLKYYRIDSIEFGCSWNPRMHYYSPASEATLTGDYVGVESCIDLRNEEDFEAYARDCERSYERRRMMRKAELKVVEDRRRQVREFPPPITCLARTENQPSHMPWVMKRYYTTDGRLVIREEKVKHHEYFRAHRADGRLTLQLIPLDCDYDDDDVEDGCSVTAVQSGTDLAVDGCGISEFKNDAVNEGEDEKEDEEKNEDESMEMVEEEQAVGDGMGGDETMIPAPVLVSSISMSSLCITEGVNTRGESGGGSRGLLASASFSSLAASGGGGGGSNKCYGFHSLRSSSASSLFHLQVPAIRPVIS